MNTNKKKLLAIVSLILIMVFAGAAVMVSYRINSQQKVAPTAPQSEPKAAEADEADVPSEADELAREAAGTPKPKCGRCVTTANCQTGLICDTVDGRCKTNINTTICWSMPASCIVSGKATALPCVPTDVITCTPDCPTECGLAASTISTCTDSCNGAKTKACPATTACTGDITISKKAFKFDGGTYAYTTEIESVSKNQSFLYAAVIKNEGAIDATGVNITDTLNGENQDQLTFVDAKSGCTYSPTDRKVSCSNLTLKAGEEVTYAFKVKVGADAVNGDIIKNTVFVEVNGENLSATKDLTISTIVGCNHTCTGDTECSDGLVCDGTTGKCRKGTCAEEDNCLCPQVTAEPTARPTARTTAEPTARPTEGEAEAPVVVPTAVAGQPTVLPEAGILDFPGVAAFGGGLMLAIIGILLAL